MRYRKAVDNRQTEDAMDQIQNMVQSLNSNRGSTEKARIEALLLQLKQALEVIISVLPYISVAKFFFVFF